MRSFSPPKRHSRVDDFPFSLLVRYVSFSWREEKKTYVGLSPLPVTVTTRIITFLVGDLYKPSFATVTGRGDNPRHMPKIYKVVDCCTKLQRPFANVSCTIFSIHGAPNPAGPFFGKRCFKKNRIYIYILYIYIDQPETTT